MNTNTIINYRGQKFQCRSFKHFNNKEHLICPDSLHKAIFDDEAGWFRDKEALDINDRVLYTVPDHMINSDFKTIMFYIINDAETEAQ